MTKVKQIVFTKKNTAELLDEEVRDLMPNEVKVRTTISTLSCGTERANISGDLNVNIYEPAAEKAVFPRYGGYSSAGEVVEVGEAVKNLAVGDRVAMCCTVHKAINIVEEQNAVKIRSDKVSDSEAAMAFIGSFSIAAIRKTKLEIGESCLVMGLGILGQLAIQYARASGAVPVIAADPVEERRKIALESGADYVLNPLNKDFSEQVKQITDGGVNVALEVSGVGAGLVSCLDCMAPFGRLALEGCTRNCDFTVDFYRRVHGCGVQIIGANSAARPKFESSANFFTIRDDIKSILKLCGGKRVDMKNLVKEIHSPEDCAEVYERLVNEKNFPVCVQFDWTKLS